MPEIEGLAPKEVVVEIENRLVDAVRRNTGKVLSQPGAAKLIRKLFDTMSQFADRMAEEVDKDVGLTADLPCRRGCSYCCHQDDIGVRPFEVFPIAEHLSKTLLKKPRQELIEKLKSLVAEKATLSPEDRRTTLFPCPLLEDGACSVYEVRPFICRSHNSVDVSLCERNYRDRANNPNIEVYHNLQRIYLLTWDSLRLAQEDARLQSSLLSLEGALLIALTERRVLQRWLSGERVFEAAELTEPETPSPGSSPAKA